MKPFVVFTLWLLCVVANAQPQLYVGQNLWLGEQLPIAQSGGSSNVIYGINIQRVQINSPGLSGSTPFLANNIAGNMLIAFAGDLALTANSPATNCTDTAGNNWQLLATNVSNLGNSPTLSVFVAYGCKAGANTVTVSPVSGIWSPLTVAEYSGINIVTNVVQVVNQSGSSLTVQIACSNSFAVIACDTGQGAATNMYFNGIAMGDVNSGSLGGNDNTIGDWVGAGFAPGTTATLADWPGSAAHTLIGLVCIGTPYITNLYVDNSGSDANSGGIGHAWQHAAYAGSNAPAGAFVYFTSGQTFTESNVIITHSNITWLSTASTPATIQANNGSNAIYGFNTPGVTLSNMNFYGWNISNCWAGIGFQSRGVGNCAGLKLISCAVSNCQFAVNLDDESAGHGFDNLWMSNDLVTLAKQEGIYTTFAGGQGLNETNFVIVSCSVSNILGDPTQNSGTGIGLYGVNGLLISNCIITHLATNSAAGAGGAGAIVTVFGGNNQLIESNLVDTVNQLTNGNDGVGIDLDEAVSNSIVQFNVVKNTQGSGLYDFRSGGNNIWRNNFVTNCATSNGASMWLNNALSAAKLSTNYIYSNVLWSASTAISFGTLTNAANCISNNSLANNSGSYLIAGDTFSVTNGGFFFSHNNYWPPNFVAQWPSGQTNLVGLAGWQSVGQDSTGTTNKPF